MAFTDHGFMCVGCRQNCMPLDKKATSNFTARYRSRDARSASPTRRDPTHEKHAGRRPALPPRATIVSESLAKVGGGFPAIILPSPTARPCGQAILACRNSNRVVGERQEPHPRSGAGAVGDGDGSEELNIKA